MTDTKHLDAAISIFSGSGVRKRAKRKVQAEITVEAYGKVYTIQLNGKVLEEGVGSAAYARERAEARADRVRALGRTVMVTVY